MIDAKKASRQLRNYGTKNMNEIADLIDHLADAFQSSDAPHEIPFIDSTEINESLEKLRAIKDD